MKNPGQPDEEHWPSKVTARPLKAGDCLEITVPNAGGYGEPYRRDPEKVLSDVLDQCTTIDRAERDYGVAIEPATLAVDTERTAQLRCQHPARS